MIEWMEKYIRTLTILININSQEYSQKKYVLMKLSIFINVQMNKVGDIRWNFVQK